MVFIFWQFKHFNIRPSELSNFDRARERDLAIHEQLGFFWYVLKFLGHQKGFSMLVNGQFCGVLYLKQTNLLLYIELGPILAKYQAPKPPIIFVSRFHHIFLLKRWDYLIKSVKVLSFMVLGHFLYLQWNVTINTQN